MLPLRTHRRVFSSISRWVASRLITIRSCRALASAAVCVAYRGDACRKDIFDTTLSMDDPEAEGTPFVMKMARKLASAFEARCGRDGERPAPVDTKWLGVHRSASTIDVMGA